MGDGSGIEWTSATWNPVVGCSKVSTGCRECYAEEVHRTRLNGVHGYPVFRPWSTVNAAHNVTLMPGKLDQPLRWRKPRMVFVNSMSDLFHEQIPWEYVAEVFAIMSIADHHMFQVLTKRPERMRALLSWPMFWLHVNAVRMRRAYPVLPGGMSGFADGSERFPLPSVWLGVSIENRKWVGRADILRDTPAAVRFISAEPLLGPLVHDSATASTGPPIVPGIPAAYSIWGDGYTGPELDLTGIDWLILGGESGSGHRPLDVQWMRDLRDGAEASGTALFVKQLGGHRPGTALEDLPEDLRIREFPVTAPERARQ